MCHVYVNLTFSIFHSLRGGKGNATQSNSLYSSMAQWSTGLAAMRKVVGSSPGSANFSAIISDRCVIVLSTPVQPSWFNKGRVVLGDVYVSRHLKKSLGSENYGPSVSTFNIRQQSLLLRDLLVKAYQLIKEALR